MDLEQLTKHQIILLTLLVSFVASIATGIVTVSLMNQAPPSVTRTINQIVEHTVQTVTPSNNGPVTNTVKTVVVKDEDLAAQSIASLQKGIIRITAKGSNDLIARGVIIEASGVAITDKAALEDSGALSFEAILPGGQRVPATIKKSLATTSPLAILSLVIGTSTGFAAVPLAEVSKLQLGQSVLRISGEGVDVVDQGVIAMLPSGQSSKIEASTVSKIPGSLIATRFGELIGITTSDSLDSGADFYSIVKLGETKQAATP
ncbi:MAG: serine protease Do [Patescibacteria group bacterium]|nr:serine protease Do [Patescibacteria group bacterium]